MASPKFLASWSFFVRESGIGNSFSVGLSSFVPTQALDEKTACAIQYTHTYIHIHEIASSAAAAPRALSKRAEVCASLMSCRTDQRVEDVLAHQLILLHSDAHVLCLGMNDSTIESQSALDSMYHRVIITKRNMRACKSQTHTHTHTQRKEDVVGVTSIRRNSSDKIR